MKVKAKRDVATVLDKARSIATEESLQTTVRDNFKTTLLSHDASYVAKLRRRQPRDHTTVAWKRGKSQRKSSIRIFSHYLIVHIDTSLHHFKKMAGKSTGIVYLYFTLLFVHTTFF